jgi:preprotein translocase subunit SecG
VYLLLLTLLILDAILLLAVVLLQAGKGGGLAAMGAAGAGSDTLFGSRQATNLLTKATWWAGGIFLVLAFILSLMSGQTRGAESILRGVGTVGARHDVSPPLIAPVVQPVPSGEPAAPQAQPPSN